MRWFRRSPRAISWLSVAFIPVVLYVLSFAPACWIAMRLDSWKHPLILNVLANAYFPVAVVVIKSPPPIRETVQAFLQLGTPRPITDVFVDDHAILWCIPGYSITFFSI